MSTFTPKPVYVLQGRDSCCQDDARRKLIGRILAGADPQLCLGGFDADVELSVVLDELRTLPFLAPHRVVVIRDAEAFISANREALEKYLQNPASGGTLILCVGNLDSRMRLTKLISAIGEIIDCSAPQGAQLQNWLKHAAELRGKVIAPAAAAMLCEWIGEDLSMMNLELDKLAAYVGQQETITVSDITAIASSTAVPESFAVVNAIIAGNVREALKTLATALGTRGAEFPLLGQLSWHIRRSLTAQQQIQAGRPQQTAIKNAKVFFNQQAFASMLRRRPLKKLQSDCRKLIAADMAMKSGTTAATAMQQLVVALCT